MIVVGVVVLEECDDGVWVRFGVGVVRVVSRLMRGRV